MSTKNIDFHTYKNLIRRFAWKYAKCYRLDYQELESEGFLIFVEAIKKFDYKYSSFSTFLYIRLKGYLQNFCEKEIRVRKNIKKLYNEYNYNIRFKKMIEKIELYNSIERELSEDSKKVLNYIFSGITKQSYNSISKLVNWKPKRLKKSLEEIKKWWKNYNIAA